MNERTSGLIGDDNLRRLTSSSVLLFGVGGVGGFIAESLIRSGVGRLTIVDGDVIEESNLNRQLIALRSTIGLPKTEVLKKRLLDINPHAHIQTENVFYLPENASAIPFSGYDYVVDAIDTVTAKLEIIMRAKLAEVNLISCMGTGNRLDISALRIGDISETKYCPLARTIRHELKKRNITDVQVAYSLEQPLKTGVRTPSSMIFVPAAAGLMIAAKIVRDITTTD